jgi:hypothetical protein
MRIIHFAKHTEYAKRTYFEPVYTLPPGRGELEGGESPLLTLPL